MDDLYLDTIIDRYKHPTNAGWISDAQDGQEIIVRKALNAGCGDSFEVSFLVEAGTIVDARWRGQGCAISTVSTDTFCEWVIGKSHSQIDKLTSKELMSLVGLETITAAREKCLYLPLQLTANQGEH